MRAQILGQLSERLNYDKLYQQALSDPELKRTEVELEAALSNSREAREVVFDLFQDLDGFSLDEYKPLADVSTMMERLHEFLAAAVADRGWTLRRIDDTHSEVEGPDTGVVHLTTSREAANASEGLTLLGLDHPLLQAELARWRALAPEQLGLAVKAKVDERSMLCLWHVEARTQSGQRQIRLQAVAVDAMGRRLPAIERHVGAAMRATLTHPGWSAQERLQLLASMAEPALQRELRQRAMAGDSGSYAADLIGFVELVPGE